MAGIKRIYICCEEGKEQFFKERAKDVYQEYACIQDRPGEDTDMIVIIRPEGKGQDGFITRCLGYAENIQKRAVVVSENFIPAGAMERVLGEG